jgi:D-glycero-D-manno-heptose 1,7-bisphosphate phosphatase
MPQQRETRRAIFLDRDGVINRAIVRAGRPFSPRTLEALEILPGVPEALSDLRRAGFMLIVVTNQPDIARGLMDAAQVERLNAALQSRLGFDQILVCPHDTADGCACRKPKPGLLLRAAETWGIHLPESYMVGDRKGDMEAGTRARCRTVFLAHGYDEPQPERADLCVKSLLEAVPWIVQPKPPLGKGSP